MYLEVQPFPNVRIFSSAIARRAPSSSGHSCVSQTRPRRIPRFGSLQFSNLHQIPVQPNWTATWVANGLNIDNDFEFQRTLCNFPTEQLFPKFQVVLAQDFRIRAVNTWRLVDVEKLVAHHRLEILLWIYFFSRQTNM